MSRDNPRTPRFGTMLVEPPPRKHSGTMVLETPRPAPGRTSEAPQRPCAPPPFEPTEILGADYGHLGMPEEETSIATGAPSGPTLPFAPTHGEPPAGPRPDQPIPASPWDPSAATRPRVRSGAIYSTAEMTLAQPVARGAPPARGAEEPARVALEPARVAAPPAHVPVAPTTATPPAYLGPITHADRRAAGSASPFKNEPIGEMRGAPAARPTPTSADTRKENHARLAALLQGPWLFPNEDD